MGRQTWEEHAAQKEVSGDLQRAPQILSKGQIRGACHPQGSWGQHRLLTTGHTGNTDSYGTLGGAFQKVLGLRGELCALG